MYLFISSTEITPYDGEILKRYVGRKLVKTIANPTEQDLKEFGYMEVVEVEIPEYNAETQNCLKSYDVVEGKICPVYVIEDIPLEENPEEIIEETTEE